MAIDDKSQCHLLLYLLVIGVHSYVGCAGIGSKMLNAEVLLNFEEPRKLHVLYFSFELYLRGPSHHAMGVMTFLLRSPTMKAKSDTIQISDLKGWTFHILIRIQSTRTILLLELKKSLLYLLQTIS